jgi:hypothetical protein
LSGTQIKTNQYVPQTMQAAPLLFANKQNYFNIQHYSNYPDAGYPDITSPIQMLVIRIASYMNQLGLSGNFVENFTKLICLEIPSFWINISLTSSSKSQ